MFVSQPRTPFVMLLIEAAEGEKVSFFRSVKAHGIEVKIYFTGKKVMLAKFEGRSLIEFQAWHRRDNESLLGVEGSITESLRRNAFQLTH